MPQARQAYLTALYRARKAGDVDALLAVTGAFAALGDRETARASLELAHRLAGTGTEAAQRVQAAERRIDETLADVARVRRAAAPGA